MNHKKNSQNYTLTDIYLELRQKITDEEQRQLILGVAVMSGALSAAKDSSKYQSSAIANQEEEITLIAQQIRQYSRENNVGPSLESAVKELLTLSAEIAAEPAGKSWRRIQGIVDWYIIALAREGRIYGTEHLQEIGEITERGLNGVGNRHRHRLYHQDLAALTSETQSYEQRRKRRLLEEQLDLKCDLQQHFKKKSRRR